MINELLSELGNRYKIERMLTILSENAGLKPKYTNHDFVLEINLTDGVTILTDEVFRTDFRDLFNNKNPKNDALSKAVTIFKSLKQKKYDTHLLAVFCEKENKFLITAKISESQIMFRVYNEHTQISLINAEEMNKEIVSELVKVFKTVHKIHQIKDYNLFITLLKRTTEKKTQNNGYDSLYY